jgi:hypothetical protein
MVLLVSAGLGSCGPREGADADAVAGTISCVKVRVNERTINTGCGGRKQGEAEEKA